jgi:putative DNA primase/helicase
MSTRADLPSPMASAALQYARRGWPIFPCRECDGEPYQIRTGKRAGEMVTPKAKQPYVATGLKAATADETQILRWWKQWPNAMIGLPLGAVTRDGDGFFALDFDPRHDPETGEDFTLELLKERLEAQMGCAVPESLAVRTPSGGVHIYLRQPRDGGEEIRNRGNLPEHVDVRGRGGYVIAPPSIIVEPCADATPGKYRWLRGRVDAPVAEAPPALIEILRDRSGRRAEERSTPSPAASARSPTGSSGDVDDRVREAIRKYGLAALDAELERVRSAASGKRNAQLNESALKIAALTVSTPIAAIDGRLARSLLEAAARENPGRDGDGQLLATIESGWSAGINNPRNLGEVAATVIERARRAPSARRSSRPPAPSNDENGKPTSREGGIGAKSTAKGGAGPDLARSCAFLPLTDLGNLERFLKRHGNDFLHVEAWGWLAWDGKRWSRDMAEPLLGAAVQETIRAIQDEAEWVRSSGVPWPPEGGFPVDDLSDDDDEDAQWFKHSDTVKKQRKTKNVLWWQQRQLARKSHNAGERFDTIVQVKSNGDIVLLSDKLAAWGRTSEGAGHINCIAKLAEARLAARTQDFDSDPLLLNLQNGTIVFERPGEHGSARYRFREHRREDRITKIGNADYLAGASSPLFDRFISTVQPSPEMREFLEDWGGYNCLGLADAQKMAVFYGEGSNGKGVWVSTVAWCLGDYAWSTGIETFMDAGRTRKGSEASPDLAALAGRRMVYANEPEDNSKFADGLVKSLTSDEPKGGVRELMKPPFELQITFTNTVMANNMPRISTDHGIQRRVQIVPWEVIIPDDQQDLQLKAKLRLEASGVLNRLIAGALRYLDRGLMIPEAVKEATREYQQENDPLGRFLELCVARVKGETVGATPMHRVFAAWQTWAGQLPQTGKPWSPKFLNAQMRRKGFRITKSSSMVWQDVFLRYAESDFTDHEGKPREGELPKPRRAPGEDAPEPPRDGVNFGTLPPSADWDEDDLMPP